MNPPHPTRLNELRREARQRLASRFVLRGHMAILVALTSGAAFLASRALDAFGFDRMGLRYALVVALAYGVFLALVRLWLTRLESALAPSMNRRLETALVGRPDRAPVDRSMGAGVVGRAVDAAEGAGHAGELIEIGASALEGEGAFVAIGLALVGVVVAVFLAMGWTIWAGPTLLADAAFEIVVAAALTRLARPGRMAGWSRGLVRATWIPFVVVLAVSALGGWGAQGYCPTASSMGQVAKTCVFGDPPANRSTPPGRASPSVRAANPRSKATQGPRVDLPAGLAPPRACGSRAEGPLGLPRALRGIVT